MKKFLLLILFLPLFISCNHSSEPKFYGEEFDPKDAISVQDLAGKMSGQAKLDAIVTGKIISSCQSEGCWLNLENPAGDEVYVDWDERFHLPRDISGQTVFIKGYAFHDTISIDRLRHLAEDAGRPQAEMDKITEPKIKVVFKAEGVKL
jgi:hypothetical protein